MALSALTIGTNIGLAGARFVAPLVGVEGSGSQIRVVQGNARVGSDGLVVDNLGFGVSNVRIIEVSGTGSGYRYSDVVLYGIAAIDDRSVALAALAKGQTDAQQRAAIAAGSTAFAGLQATGIGYIPPVAGAVTVFYAVNGAALSSVVESNVMNIVGVGTGVAVSVAGGSYSINGGAYVTAPGVVSDGDTVKVRLTTGSANSVTSSATLTVAGVGKVFSVTTAAVVVGPTQLTASPSTASVAANAASGTLLFNIGGVPAGVTPSVSPNDGRFAIAGDATNGWKVVTGLSALSAGTVSVSVSATGATSVSVPVTISAAGGSVASPSRMWAASNQRVTNTQAVTSFQTGTQSKFVFDSSSYFGSFSRYGEIIPQYNHWHVDNTVPFAVKDTGFYTIDEQWFIIVTPDSVAHGPVRVTKGGANTWTVDNSSPFIAADAIQPSAFGLTEIPKGSYYRTYGIIDRGTAPYLVQTGFLTSQAGSGVLVPRAGAGYQFDPSANAGYTLAGVGTGTIAVPSGGTSKLFKGGFVGIKAQFLDVSTEFNSVTAFGDSITANGDAHFLLGWDVPSENKIIPGLTIGASSGQLQQMVADTTGYVEAAITGGDASFNGMGANDFFYNRTEAQFRGDSSTYLDRTVARCKFQRQVYPRVTGTPFTGGTWANGIATLTVVDGSRLVDGGSYFVNFGSSTGWTSQAYPTVITKTGANTFTIPMATDPGKAYVPALAATDFIGDDQRTTTAMYPATPQFAPGADRATFNSTGLPALVAAGKLSAFTDTTAVQDATLPWAWKTDGGVKTFVNDTGTHPTTAGMKLGETAGRTYLTNRLTSGIPTLPTVSISGAISKAEGNSGASLYTYTVTRSATAGATSVPWTFAAGGTSADDFTGGAYPTGGSVAMADGVGSASFSVSVNGDTVVESDENFTVALSAPSGYALGSPSSATGTIVNDDAPPATPVITFSVTTVSVAEGNTGTTDVTNTINVNRNGVAGDLVVNLAYAGTATSGTDYVTPPTSVTILAANSSVSFVTTINGDTTVEADETIIINASLAAYSGQTASKTITITNDDVSSTVTYLDHTFAGTNGADLATVAPTTGGAWSAFTPPGGAGVMRVNTTNGGALYNDAIANVAYVNAVPITADHIVIIGSGLSKNTLATSGGTNGNDILFGVVDAATGNGVVFGYYNLRLQIYSQSSGVRTSLVASPPAFTLGADTKFKLDLDQAAQSATLSTSTDGGTTYTAGPTVAAGNAGIVKPTNPRAIVQIDASNLTAAQAANTGKHITSIKVMSA